MSADSAGSPVAAPVSRTIQDVVIRFAGNSQDGIQSIGGFLARLAGRTEKDVMTYMTIPATISGGPSIYQVRLGTGDVLSAGDDVDILVAFYQHSYNDHINTLRDGGILIYDSDNVQPDPNQKRSRSDCSRACSTLMCPSSKRCCKPTTRARAKMSSATSSAHSMPGTDTTSD